MGNKSAASNGWRLNFTPTVIIALLMLVTASNARGREQPPAAVVVGKESPALEQFAAAELCRYLERLFGVKTSPVDKTPRASSLFLVGTAQTNPEVKRALRYRALPPLSEQAIVLKSVEYRERPTLVISGGSPRAVLWAVYELAERWGVCFLLHGDVLPKDRPAPLTGLDIVKEPLFPVRQWRVMNEHVVSQVSWGMAEYRVLIDQLAKLKINRLLVYIWQTQPFLSYQVQGIRTSSGTLYFGYRYPITADTIGRHLFDDRGEFWNPDLPLPGSTSHAEMEAAGKKLVQGIVEYAKSRGMECVMSATLTEFPPEFAPLLKSPKFFTYHKVKVVMPGAGTPVDDPGLTELASTVLRATVDTYPGVDYLALEPTEFREWVDEYQTAWRALDAKYGLEKLHPLEQIIAAARNRPDYPGGPDRAVAEVKGDIVALRFYDRLLSEQKVLAGSARPDVKLIFSSLAEELFPILPKVMPPGSETLNFIDYTSSRVLRRRDQLRRIPICPNPAVFIFTLADDNVGILPQLSTGSIHKLTRELQRLSWAGFSSRLWLLSDQDPSAAYLARASWDSSVTPESIYREQLSAVCGEACVEDMLTAFRELEIVTEGLEWHGLGLGFFTPQLMMKHWQAKPMPEEYRQDRAGYQRALDAVHRARVKATDPRADYLNYWLGRLEFGVLYFDTVEAVRNAALAEKSGQRTEALTHAEKAADFARRAIEAYVKAARDQSDRAAIAVLNEYVYRPLRAKAEELRK